MLVHRLLSTICSALFVNTVAESQKRSATVGSQNSRRIFFNRIYTRTRRIRFWIVDSNGVYSVEGSTIGIDAGIAEIEVSALNQPLSKTLSDVYTLTDPSMKFKPRSFLFSLMIHAFGENIEYFTLTDNRIVRSACDDYEEYGFTIE